MFNGKPQTIAELIEEVENGKFDEEEEVLRLTKKMIKKNRRIENGDDVREFSGNVN